MYTDTKNYSIPALAGTGFQLAPIGIGLAVAGATVAALLVFRKIKGRKKKGKK